MQRTLPKFRASHRPLPVPDLYTSLAGPGEGPSDRSGRRPRPAWRWAALGLAFFLAGVGTDAAILHLGRARPAAGVVIGQRLVRPAPPSQTLPRSPASTVPGPSLTWDAPAAVDPMYAPQSVSCPTAGFCVVVDDHGQSILYQNDRWSGPVPIDGSAQINAVSCATRSFCVAVDQDGYAMTFNGTGWSRPDRVDRSVFAELTSVSCSSPSFCAAVDGNGNALTYNGRSWSAPEQVDPQGWSSSPTSRDVPTVSCPADDFCVGIDPAGSAFYYVGDSWQTASSLDPSSTGPVAPAAKLRNPVSCATSTSCVAAENPGGVVTYNGSGWSFPVVVDPSNYVESVSCPSPTFCAAADGLLPQGFSSGTGTGEVFTYNGLNWSGAQNVDPGGIVQSISCADPAFCLAVDRAGHAIIGTAAGPARRPRRS